MLLPLSFWIHLGFTQKDPQKLVYIRSTFLVKGCQDIHPLRFSFFVFFFLNIWLIIPNSRVVAATVSESGPFISGFRGSIFFSLFFFFSLISLFCAAIHSRMVKKLLNSGCVVRGCHLCFYCRAFFDRCNNCSVIPRDAHLIYSNFERWTLIMNKHPQVCHPLRN